MDPREVRRDLLAAASFGVAGPGRACYGHPMTRIVLVFAVVFWVAGCAADQSRWIPDRPNGQPAWIPCMAGDRLCTPH